METRDWRELIRWIANLLERRTGDDVETWNTRIREAGLSDEQSVRAWLTDQGVTGYPQGLLVMERFGYPSHLIATADELIDAQYQDRPGLRLILDAILASVATLGDVTIQARKTYVSLLTPRRTFAAVQATTKQRVDLGLRLVDEAPSGRLQSAASMGSSQVTVRVGLTSLGQVDDEVADWLRRAYEENV